MNPDRYDTEYAVELAPESGVIEFVTDDRGSAEEMLQWIPGSRLVTRQVTYTEWEPVT